MNLRRHSKIILSHVWISMYNVVTLVSVNTLKHVLDTRFFDIERLLI